MPYLFCEDLNKGLNAELYRASLCLQHVAEESFVNDHFFKSC